VNDDNNDIEDRGDCIRIPFDLEQQKQMASQSRPLLGNTHELKVSFVTYLKENKPELLECQVEKALKDHRHRVLWTPLYCRELQPIELFRAAGKNHAPWMHYSGRTMKELVSNLREGWYGNADAF
jgi:transposase